ncbi:conserved membrane protein of unknown function [Candidatus Hydrogenisulfobacillus filiaventi]|uniref:DUF2269 domain-containing protein n=1 Tax=Candidatus Hydrogenisulfobacillus filiaventi TaxID=2707344 RepID=A0A6F8ZJD1_9FIRM|nr:hypothetical protein [Bacillota bacterium]CAB1129896.1 conserved membrane protein of unknown function [Candidatus Hydrogenisulfobacillus filiaventi]
MAATLSARLALARALTWLHLANAFVLLLIPLGLTVAGFGASRRRHPLTAGWWRWQGGWQVAVLVQAAAGIAMVALGLRPKDPLHYLYGALAVLILLAERGLMADQPLRVSLEADYGRFNEAKVYAWINLVAFLVAARGLTTGLFGF